MEPPRIIRDREGNPVDSTVGKTIQFEDHVYETRDPKEQEFLRQFVGGDLTIINSSDEVPRPTVEVSEALSTGSVAGKPQLRCETCGRAGFRNPMALAMHQRSHKQPAEAEAPAAPG
jgi:hypothetical protein